MLLYIRLFFYWLYPFFFPFLGWLHLVLSSHFCFLSNLTSPLFPSTVPLIRPASTAYLRSRRSVRCGKKKKTARGRSKNELHNSVSSSVPLSWSILGCAGKQTNKKKPPKCRTRKINGTLLASSYNIPKFISAPPSDKGIKTNSKFLR